MALPVKPADVPEDLENPVRGEPRGTFAAKANEFLRRLVEDYTPALNAMADWINATAIEIESIASDVSSDASSASASASNAADILSDVQQIQATLDQDVQINDTTASTTSVYSSTKTEQVALDLIDDNSVAVDKTWSAQKLFDEVGQGSVVRATASGAINESDLVSLVADGRLEKTQSGGVSDLQADVILTDTNNCVCDRLSDTSYAVAFNNQDSSDRGQFAIVDASGSVPVVGTPEIFKTGITFPNPTSLVALSDTKFVIFCSGIDSAFVVDISGTTSVTETAITNNGLVRAKLIDVDKIALISIVGADVYTSIIDVNPDDTVTQSTPIQITNASNSSITLAVVDSSKFIVTYSSVSPNSHIRSRTCDVSGSSITVNAEQSLYSFTTSRPYASDLVNGYLCVGFWTNNPASSTRVLSASIDGSTITAVDNVVVQPESGVTAGVKLDATQLNTASFLWQEATSQAGKIAPIKVDSDGSISVGSSTVFRVTAIANASQCYLSANKVAAFYRDQGNDQSGDTFTAEVVGGNTQEWIGFSREDTIDGAENSASVNGVVEGLSGLTINKTYYVDSATASLTQSDTGIKVGRAIATDKLLITGVGAY